MVIGGGMVGAAIAYGCAHGGARTLMIDQGDDAPRAARANAGLVWSQGKGDGMPAYAAWTRASVAAWPDFAEALSVAGGRTIGYRRAGGIAFCLGDAEFDARRLLLHRLHNQAGGPSTPLRLLDRAEVSALLPGVTLGEAVSGGCYAPEDGDVNPLLLLRGLHAGLRQAGGAYWPGRTVTTIEPSAHGFVITTDGAPAQVAGEKVVIACGLGIPRLAAMVGLDVPVHPVRGQMMVTERLAPLLPLPCSGVRQTQEGSVQIGTTYEEGEADPATTPADLSRMAARAIAVIPALAAMTVLRCWAGIRPMTPDAFPIYAQSASHPGAFAAVCHSGVTLAAAHAGRLAAAVLAGVLPATLADLHPDRFS